MFKNYIKIAWRSIWKQKFFSLINIISLSIGLSASLVIGMMVYHDFSFDKFHEKADQMYRVTSDMKMNTFNFSSSGTPVPLGDDLVDKFPEVDLKVHFFTHSADKVTREDGSKESTINDRIIFTDPTYFKFIDYNWLAGNPATALNQPNQLVLTKSRAEYFFPNVQPESLLGEVLLYDETPMKITGIVADIDQNTDFIFTDFLNKETISQTVMADQAKQDYGSINSFSQLWILLRSDANVSDFQERLTEFSMSKRDKEEIADEVSSSFNLQPLSEVHFNTQIGVYDQSRDQANKSVLISLIFVALFLVLLAVVNFINLNTASATQRANEIGVRKTLGSSRGQLITQFLGETFLLTLFAFIVSIGMSFMLLEIFSDFVAAGIDLSLLLRPDLILGMIVLILIVTMLSGFYPAMVLSGFKPSRVLKGGNRLSKGNTNVRKGLTVFQFVIAQVFIIGTLLVGKQIKFMMYADLGFEKEQRVFVNTPWRESDIGKKQALEQKIAAISGVEMTSLGSTPPASSAAYVNDIEVFNGEKDVKLAVRQMFGDTKYLDLYEIPVVAGRQPLNDTINEFMLNEKAVRELGFVNVEDIVNQKAIFSEKEYKIVGVLPDFNQNSLHYSVMSLAFMNDTARKSWGNFSTVHLKVNAITELRSIITEIEKAYVDVYPNETPSIHFLDEEVAAFYRKDQQLEKLLNWATGLSILISCLGLLGLVVHTTERRRKEIGVRKVLGATVAQINTLLCKDFVLLIAIAFVIAAPIAYYFIQDYLNDFVFRTDISIWIFLGSIAAMTLIALAVMSFKTVSTAMRNPVESLKTE